MKLILVETERTFELFEDIEKAFQYCKQEKNIKKIDLVDVNPYLVFYENGELNYDDRYSLIRQGILSSTY